MYGLTEKYGVYAAHECCTSEGANCVTIGEDADPAHAWIPEKSSEIAPNGSSMMEAGSAFLRRGGQEVIESPVHFQA